MSVYSFIGAKKHFNKDIIMIHAYTGICFMGSVLLLILKVFYHMCESVYNLFTQQEKNVNNEIVLITGAGHGIGRELAIQYACLNTTIVCLDVNPKTNEETVNEIAKTSRKPAYAYQCDISNREDVLKIAEKVKKDVGDVTILVNNAGIMPCHAFLDYTPDQIRQNFDINIISHFWMLQAFLPSMIEKNHGHIVAISSLAGLAGIPYLIPYSATKYAVRGFMEAISDELRISTMGKSLIKFTTIFPYMVNTGLCKKPKIKFTRLMSLISPKDVAAQIISAQRRNFKERSVPSFWLSFVSINRVLPEKAIEVIRDFFDSGVEPEN